MIIIWSSILVYTLIQNLSCLQVHKQRLTWTQVPGLPWLQNAHTYIINFSEFVIGCIFRPALACWVIVYSDQVLVGMLTSSWCSSYTHILSQHFNFAEVPLLRRNWNFVRHFKFQFNQGWFILRFWFWMIYFTCIPCHPNSVLKRCTS